MSTQECNSEIIWCLDSGSSAHICTEREKLGKINKINRTLNLANSESTNIIGKGNVEMSINNGQNKNNVNFEEVYYVPDLRTNLLSVSKITDHGFEVRFRKNEAIVIDKNGKIIFKANRVGNLYYVQNKGDNQANLITDLKKEENIAMTVSHKINDVEHWHLKLGHLNVASIKNMAKNGVLHGLSLSENEDREKCKVCIREKQVRAPFSKAREDRTTELLEIVHTDVCGPMKIVSFSGAKYFVTFIDDKSRWCEIFFIKQKSEFFDVFKKYKTAAENLTGNKIKALQSDDGKEYRNREFDNFLEQHCIARRLSTPYSPQQNGVAERKNRTR